MAKSKKSVFVCQECGSDQPKWQGQCPDCGAWNTLQEVRIAPSKGQSQGYAGQLSETKKLSEIQTQSQERISSGLNEFDRVLGGGLIAGSVILLGGHPGAGKSTLLLQALSHLSLTQKVLYVTGEESLQQIALRAQRLNVVDRDIELCSETSVTEVVRQAERSQAQVLVVDSIQVMHSDQLDAAPGSVSQVRECAAMLTRLAKQNDTIVFLIGHVTKEGNLAGPKVLEHMIDCSILLEGDHDARYRTLRGSKNRFGPVNELGVFAMMEKGLVEVKNPSAIFLSRAENISPGSVVTVLWEGTRSLLVELQALVDDIQGGHPKRVTLGLEQNRLSMLLAILHRHGGLLTSDQDVFVSLVGGVKSSETSTDLALVLAVISSLKGRSIPEDWVVFGEIGLAGEIRPVTSGQDRVFEASKYGFKKAIVPQANSPRKAIPGMDVMTIRHVSEVLDLI